jgi:hypothetical protein
VDGEPQVSLFAFRRVGDIEVAWPPAWTGTFGPAYDAARDGPRLQAQMARVYALMRDGRWRTLAEIAEATGDPPASVSAQLRHLRKPRFGGHRVEKRRRVGGLWEYRLCL